MNACTVTSGGRVHYYECAADHLARTVSVAQLPHTELADRRLFAAVAACEQL
jgi:hypothetical protein